MDVEARIREKREVINRELDRILYRDDSELYRAMRYSVLSAGKRFRPLLAICTGGCLGASQKILLPYGCALELIHNYSLIHDDLPLMDDDDFRRGKPSCHKAFGEDTALLAGDGLLTLAFYVLAKAPVPDRNPAVKDRIIAEISSHAGAEGMIGGQFLDMTLSGEQATRESVLELMHKKTGALITVSVRTGALLGEASEEQLSALTEYGKNIGLAFQLRDDIQDLSKDLGDKNVQQPSSVSVFSAGEARKRLEQAVQSGIRALEGVSLLSDELRFLAEKLLDVQRNEENDKNS